MDKHFKREVKKAKGLFYKKMVSDLKDKDTGQWYKAVKRMTSYENKQEDITVERINHLSDKEQCELIADEFSEIPSPLSTEKTLYLQFFFTNVTFPNFNLPRFGNNFPH